MNKAELFEAALKRFAEDGDKDAALVLELAGILPTDPIDTKTAVGDQLRAAVQYCTAALTNDAEWSKNENIKNALDNIALALQYLAKV